jgi:cathepsin L
MKVISLFCFFIFSTTRPTCYSTEDASIYGDLHQFTLWRIKYNKTYENKINLTDQFSAWRMNRDFINKHNENHTDYVLELNYFADLHHPLHRKDYNQIMAEHSKQHKIPTLDDNFDNVALPDSMDWRDKDIVTHIKNQQQCGSCWAFSAVGSMEGQHALKSGNLVNLSESQIVDCDINGSDAGCSGGWMDGAFKYVIAQGGIDTEESYPYDPQDDPCKFNKSNIGATFSGYKDVTGGELGLKKAVANIGPISVAIDASSSQFQFYKKGVYYDSTCSSTMLDHGVLVVGYGSTLNGTDYWIVKNSWGENWGDKGYIYMSRNRDNNCGIATDPSYPIV